jgi:hypothetical protein
MSNLRGIRERQKGGRHRERGKVGFMERANEAKKLTT